MRRQIDKCFMTGIIDISDKCTDRVCLQSEIVISGITLNVCLCVCVCVCVCVRERELDVRSEQIFVPEIQNRRYHHPIIL